MVYVHKRLRRRKKPKFGYLILFLAAVIALGILSDRGLGPVIEKQAMMQADSSVILSSAKPSKIP